MLSTTALISSARVCAVRSAWVRRARGRARERSEPARALATDLRPGALGAERAHDLAGDRGHRPARVVRHVDHQLVELRVGELAGLHRRAQVELEGGLVAQAHQHHQGGDAPLAYAERWPRPDVREQVLERDVEEGVALERRGGKAHHLLEPLAPLLPVVGLGHRISSLEARPAYHNLHWTRNVNVIECGLAARQAWSSTTLTTTRSTRTPIPCIARCAIRRPSTATMRSASGRSRATPTCWPPSRTWRASRAGTVSRSTRTCSTPTPTRPCRSWRWIRPAIRACARWSRAASRRAASRSWSRGSGPSRASIWAPAGGAASATSSRTSRAGFRWT